MLLKPVSNLFHHPGEIAEGVEIWLFGAVKVIEHQIPVMGRGTEIIRIYIPIAILATTYPPTRIE